MHLRGQTAVVTGAASGIGHALAQRLSGAGARLVIADRDVSPLIGVAGDLGAHPVAVDVSKPEDNSRLARIAGPTRVLCLNAGVAMGGAAPVWATTPEEWTYVLDTNLGGVVNGLRAFVPTMVADGQPHRIVITASLAGLATWPGGGAYAASKHAVMAVAEQAALALVGTQVSVTVLCPSLVRSGMSPQGADPLEVADQALRAVSQGVFAVVPPEWSAAVIDRARRATLGDQPMLPIETRQPVSP